jgi:chromatin remodeling complex protein RSC6
MHRFKKKQYTNPTLVRSIAHCSRARVFNKRYQRHFCGQLADVNRHNVTNYLTDEKEKREREREREKRKEKKRKKERKKKREGGKERREKDKSSGARSSAAFVSRRHRSAPLRGLSLS